jgi:hypothetical protein
MFTKVDMCFAKRDKKSLQEGTLVGRDVKQIPSGGEAEE